MRGRSWDGRKPCTIMLELDGSGMMFMTNLVHYATVLLGLKLTHTPLSIVDHARATQLALSSMQIGFLAPPPSIRFISLRRW